MGSRKSSLPPVAGPLSSSLERGGGFGCLGVFDRLGAEYSGGRFVAIRIMGMINVSPRKSSIAMLNAHHRYSFTQRTPNMMERSNSL
jgi:hypothetical protein